MVPSLERLVRVHISEFMHVHVVTVCTQGLLCVFISYCLRTYTKTSYYIYTKQVNGSRAPFIEVRNRTQAPVKLRNWEPNQDTLKSGHISCPNTMFVYEDTSLIRTPSSAPNKIVFSSQRRDSNKGLFTAQLIWNSSIIIS